MRIDYFLADIGRGVALVREESIGYYLHPGKRHEHIRILAQRNAKFHF